MAVRWAVRLRVCRWKRRWAAGPRASALAIALALSVGVVFPRDAHAGCDYSSAWLQGACGRVARVWNDGTWDAYVTGYGWHIDGFTAEERHAINAKSWGGGFGKHYTDANGNEDVLFFLVFLNSHDSPEPILGWARQWFTKPVLGGLSLGGGYFAGISARNDVAHYVPFPLVLPVVSLRYRKASLMGTFIPRLPGGANPGDLGFFWARYEF